MKVTLSEPDLAGSYVVEEQRDDGRLVLRPEPEKLSEIIEETDGKVFWSEDEFVAHLDRIERSEDDLPSDQGE